MITAVSLSPAVDKIYFIDGFSAGNLYRPGNALTSAGGKGINVARVASLLGEKVRTIGFKAGQTGRWLEEELRKLGIETDFIPVEGECRTNLNIIDRLHQKETEVLEEGPLIPEEAKQFFLHRFEDQVAQTKVLVCSGGLPRGIPYDFYKTLLYKAKQRGIKTILDTSKEILAEGIKAGPYLVKPNLRELQSYARSPLNSRGEMIKASREILRQGVKVVVLSLGSEGALLVTGTRALYARAPKVEVKNAVGSGDSMVAGFAAALVSGASLEEMFKLGMASAVTNTQFDTIGYVTLDLTEKFKKQIIIEEA